MEHIEKILPKDVAALMVISNQQIKFAGFVNIHVHNVQGVN